VLCVNVTYAIKVLDKLVEGTPNAMQCKPTDLLYNNKFPNKQSLLSECKIILYL
jgi:hypothetical protein